MKSSGSECEAVTVRISPQLRLELALRLGRRPKRFLIALKENFTYQHRHLLKGE